MKNFRILSILFVFTLLVFSNVVSAQDDGNETISTVTVAMTLDCSSLNGRDLADARRLEICPKHHNGGVTPQLTVTGSCGSATLTISSTTSSGSAYYYTALNSTSGLMVGGGLNVNWVGANGSGGFSPGLPFFQSSWSKNTLINTGVGVAAGSFSGWVGIVGTSLTCTVGPVAVSTHVS